MIFDVKDKRGIHLATIGCDAGKDLIFTDVSDDVFVARLKAAVQKGIQQRKDFYNKEKNRYIMAEKPIASSDPHFPLAFKDFLKREGYRVSERTPELDAEIIRILEIIPDENTDKANILKRLPLMTRLEKSFIMEGLRIIVKA